MQKPPSAATSHRKQPPLTLTCSLTQAIQQSLPKRDCRTHQDFVALWQEVDPTFASLYESLNSLRQAMIPRRNAQANGQKRPISYRSPDVLRAEMFRDSSTQTIRTAVERAIADQCSRFATATTEDVCKKLQQEGHVGRIEQHGSSACRLTVQREDGERFTCDLVAVQVDSRCRKFSLRHRRTYHAATPFLIPIMRINTGQCVRIVDAKQLVYPPPSGPVSVLTLGPYVLGFSATLLPRPLSSGLSLSLPSLPLSAQIGSAVLTATLALGTFFYGMVINSPLWSCIAPCILVAGLALLLRKDSSHASTP